MTRLREIVDAFRDGFRRGRFEALVGELVDDLRKRPADDLLRRFLLDSDSKGTS